MEAMNTISAQLVVTSLGVAGIALPLLAVVVAVAPYVVAGLTDLFRRDPAGPFVSHATVVQTRALAATCLILSVLALVAGQPHYFRRVQATTVAQSEGGDAALRASIAPDVQALIDSLPCAGVVVGIVQPGGNQVFGFGRRSVGTDSPPDGETVFEIGDLTQVFTASLLSRMVEKGVVRMDQPVRSLLPDTVSVPVLDGHEIELWHLATGSSGLPRLSQTAPSPVLGMLPPFSRAGRPRSAKWLYDLLSSLQITDLPGSAVYASDLGMGLLGFALERAAKTDYETLLEREICGPLALRNTRVKLTAAMRDRLAAGMTMGLGNYQGWYVASPARRWPAGPIAGAADLCSTANDLLTLLRAHLAGFPMAETLTDTRSARLRIRGGPEVGLGWLIQTTSSGDKLVWQHGAAGASRGYVAFMEGRGVGVVVLANAPVDVDLLGLRLLNRLLGPSV
jgi:CubicO group peptidase (beta-lactamase class C family)